MESLADRFSLLHGQRQSQLTIARACASLTIPSLMPPEGWTEDQQLPQPHSSVGSRGTTALASRMLSAMIPLNDTPFFKFALRNGAEPTTEIQQYLETMSYQVFRKLMATNLRETTYQVLQSLIVVGDALVHIEDDYKLRASRLDHYVVQRTVEGEVQEIIVVEYELKDPTVASYPASVPVSEKAGYEKMYCQYMYDRENKLWMYKKEDSEGETIATGQYEILPVTVIRWYGIPGENYGRSHCEDIFGDLLSLDSYTKCLLDGMAASTAFWMGLDPSGITEIDDISDQPNGAWVAARQSDVAVISPSQTMNPQVSSAQVAVESMRKEIGNAFLMTGSALPTGDRVTATAVRMIGSELETILGGAFSAIARDLMSPILKRFVFLMIENEELDKRMYDQFFDKEGTLTVEIVTGLQALSRDTDLQRLLQMGEMVRNLPPEAQSAFKWSEYAKALVTALGFDARNWVITEEEAMAMQQQQQAMKQQQMMQQQMMQTAGNVAGQAAMQDVQQTGGQGIAQVLGNLGIQQ